MIVGAAVCPGAPFLISGTADAIASRLSQVGRACAIAISGLPAADSLLLISAAARPEVARPEVALREAALPNIARGLDTATLDPHWRFLPPGTVVSTAPLRRSDDPDGRGAMLADGTAASPSGRPADIATLSVGTMVGASLLADNAASQQPRGASRAPTTAIEVAGDPVEVAAMLAARVNAAERVALLVIADGAACHGDSAPGRRDDRAAAFDAELADALAGGDPAALGIAAGQRELAKELLAAVDPLAVLALLTDRRPPAEAKLLYSGAPLGVGYLVASWRWSDA